MGKFLGYGIAVLAVVGYIFNMVAMVMDAGEPLTGLFILRAVGIFLAPLGAVLGYF